MIFSNVLSLGALHHPTPVVGSKPTPGPLSTRPRPPPPAVPRMREAVVASQGADMPAIAKAGQDFVVHNLTMDALYCYWWVAWGGRVLGDVTVHTVVSNGA